MEDKILIMILFVIISFILYFNIVAIINYSKGFELNIKNTGVKCTYNLGIAESCPNKEGSLCFTKNNNIYYNYILYSWIVFNYT